MSASPTVAWLLSAVWWASLTLLVVSWSFAVGEATSHPPDVGFADGGVALVRVGQRGDSVIVGSNGDLLDACTA